MGINLSSIGLSSISPYFHYQAVQYFYDLGNSRYLYYHGHPDIATGTSRVLGNAALMGEAVVTGSLEFENTPPINKFNYEIFTFSESYKNYYFLDLLDLKDPVRSNLRKTDDGEPVMGAFGAMTSNKIYFELVSCFVTNEDACENINQEANAPICQWYDYNKTYGDLNNNNQYDEGENYIPSETVSLLPFCAPRKMKPPIED